MNDKEMQIETQSSSSKIVHVIQNDGHSIFKSTLVGQLNGNPFLSKDRLARVRNSIHYKFTTIVMII